MGVTMSSARSADAPGVFFREEWAEIPQAIPITQEHVANPDLVLHVYGPARDSVKKSGAPFHAESYVWSGLVDSTWALSLAHREAFADFTVPGAVIRWRLNGWHTIYPIVKTAGGTWLVSDRGSPRQDNGWEVEELVIGELTWSALDIEHVVKGGAVAAPELDRIDEIGFTDLQSKACVRVDWIEVLAGAVARDVQTATLRPGDARRRADRASAAGTPHDDHFAVRSSLAGRPFRVRTGDVARRSCDFLGRVVKINAFSPAGLLPAFPDRSMQSIQWR